jgi:GNAT superfamily N-acetyltransferase
MDLEYRKDDFTITTSKSLLDINFIHQCLNNTYWAESIPLEVVIKSIFNSLTYGIFYLGKQVGFGRVITDKATFAYLADVIIEESFRGKGVASWLIDCILANPDLQNLRLILLASRDARKLYQKHGFEQLKDPERFMEIFKPDIYKH